MTRDKAINILASLAGGATQPSWEEIRKAAQFAFDVLSASSEDGVHIQFNDERTFKKEQPQGLDEAAEEYFLNSYSPVPFNYKKGVIADFKAGAKWMAGQGVKTTATVGYYNQTGLSVLTELSIKKLGFKEGDELEIILRKK